MSTHPSGETRSVNTPDAVNVSFDGRPMAAVAGQSIGAALVSNGITAWRSTRKERASPRTVLRHRHLLRLSRNGRRRSESARLPRRGARRHGNRGFLP